MLALLLSTKAHQPCPGIRALAAPAASPAHADGVQEEPRGAALNAPGLSLVVFGTDS